ncbi:hypothetical protein TIFTF001_013612 [Ficus carica]|uniref:Uncharacterized protein n=1 Tax=Ficus carica TaxID=3494 RepID=A0AA88A3S7_FICCA|nr:hypothetical protein TIFTF001_013612 [Ficus carica]
MFRPMKKRKNPRKVRFTESPSFSTASDFFFGRILMKRSRLGISRKNAEKERGNQNARDFPGKRERKGRNKKENERERKKRAGNDAKKRARAPELFFRFSSARQRAPDFKEEKQG